MTNMLSRRYVPYVLSVAIIAALAVGLGWRSENAQAQSKVTPTLQPTAPVQVTIAEPGAIGESLPAQLADKAYIEGYAVRNLSSANVLAVTTRWTRQDAEGSALPGGGCASQSTTRAELPVLKPGESKTFQQTLARGTPLAEVEIDLVLLDDGSAFGANRCGDLERIQARLDGMKMVHLAMLHVLETRGPDALESLVRTRAKEYGQQGHNEAFMRPKFVGR